MYILEITWDYVIPFLFVLTVLIYVHEWGHYGVARLNNVRVEVFSIGFGPEIYGWTNEAGTRWKISAVPLGGYVKMFGEDAMAEEKRELTPGELAVSFHHKSLGQRAAIVSAGPLANFLFAIVLLAGLLSIVGTPRQMAGVGEILPASAAADAGLKTGDRIISINGEPLASFDDLIEVVSANPGVRLDFIILRDGLEIPIAATPRPVTRENAAGQPVVIGQLGVRSDPGQVVYTRQNPIRATLMAVEQTAAMTMKILTVVGEMISGSRSADDLGGPLRIAQMSGQMAQGGIVNLIFFMAALSINLGLINLFPIPVLDGGHLFFYIFEAILGRPLSPRTQDYGFRFGLILVFLLMIFATWNDLVAWKVFDLIRDFIT